LVCVFSVLEPCRTFSLVWTDAQPFVQPAWRKCLHLYFYFLDRQLGLIPVKVQTWFPFPLQVYVNGHEWLARRLDRHGVRYGTRDNAFLQVSDLARAQHLADGFATVDWPRVLGHYARRVNPLLRDLLAPMQYYWVTAQLEVPDEDADALRRRVVLGDRRSEVCEVLVRQPGQLAGADVLRGQVAEEGVSDRAGLLHGRHDEYPAPQAGVIPERVNPAVLGDVVERGVEHVLNPLGIGRIGHVRFRQFAGPRIEAGSSTLTNCFRSLWHLPAGRA
jgi:hypothetical protein